MIVVAVFVLLYRVYRVCTQRKPGNYCTIYIKKNMTPIKGEMVFKKKINILFKTQPKTQ